ncbi:MAG: amidohydrolase family protein, partial [Pseudomonadota bacterium]
IDGDMAAGISFGMSIGSEYYSGRYSTPEEVVELSRGLSAYNGIAIAHMRSQGDAPMWYRPSRFRDIDPPSLDDAIGEMLSVATEAGATTVLTHMKAWGRYRGRAQELIDRIETVRAKGARVYMDVYPYGSSGSDGDFSALPDWAFGLESEEASDRMDYTVALRKTMSMAGKNVMGDLADDIMHQIGMRGGAKNILVLEYPNTEYVGKTFADVMEMTGKDEVDLVIALQLEGNRKKRGGGQFRSISMGQRDIETFLKQSWTATSTDGWVVLPEEAVGKKKYINTHRRCFGSFPRRLAYYSNIRKVDGLETAVRSITSLPAEILSLTDRGLLRPGMKADIAAFDIDELSDTTTYLEPNRYPVGMSFVLVNGEFVVDQGERTFALPGKVLTR